MSIKEEEILEEVYSNTKNGERIRRRKLVINDYLYKYGHLIESGKLKPTPAIEKIAKEYDLTRLGVTKILKDAGIYQGRLNPIVYPLQVLKS